MVDIKKLKKDAKEEGEKKLQPKEEPKVVPKEEPRVVPKGNRVFPAPGETDVFDIEGTAKQGATISDGRTFFGLNREEATLLTQQQREKAARPGGSLEQQAKDQAQFRQEDVEAIKAGVATEQEGVGKSIIQEREEIRAEEAEAIKEKEINRLMKLYKIDRAKAEAVYAQLNPEEGNVLRLTMGEKFTGFVREVFGDVGKDLIGLSLNQFLDQGSDPTKLEELTGQMSEAASLLPAIEGAVNNGAINPFRALAELNSAVEDGRILRGNMDRLAVLRPEMVQTQEYINMRVELEVYEADIRDARGTALERLRTTDPEFNLLETQGYIDEIDNFRKKK